MTLFPNCVDVLYCRSEFLSPHTEVVLQSKMYNVRVLVFAMSHEWSQARRISNILLQALQFTACNPHT